MSKLRIRVDKSVVVEGEQVPRVFARIQGLDDRGRVIPNSLDHVLVPISPRSRDVESVSLTPGFYRVDVTLPTGEWLSESVRVSERDQKDLVLAGEPSRAWSTWQTLSGSSSASAEPISAPRPAYKARQAKPRSLAGSGQSSASRSMAIVRSPEERIAYVMERVGLPRDPLTVRPGFGGVNTGVWEADRPADIEVERALYWLPSSNSKLPVDVLRDDPWQTLPALRGPTAHIVEVLNLGGTPKVLEAAESDGATAHFPVPNVVDDAGNHVSKTKRNFVAVHRREGVELVCLPTPWVDQMQQREVRVEVNVSRPRLEREFASAISVHDAQLSVLLGFLSSGALPAAKRLAETEHGMLFEKNINPLAAAAGGYALVNSAVDARKHQWHGWIENLMLRFLDVPDGAIQYATLRLRLRTSESDVTEATKAFKDAYRRGLPYYGLGLRWLLEGLQLVGTRDTEAKLMADAVQAVTARLHPQSPFTILRLGRQ